MRAVRYVYDFDEPCEGGRELLGGNMAIRRSAIDAAGPFDERLRGRGDETEWFARSKASFLYDPALVIRHRRDDTGLLELPIGRHHRPP